MNLFLLNVMNISICSTFFNVWTCDEIRNPCVIGVLRPKIYLPEECSRESIPFILAHEKAHIERFDNFWKVLGYLSLAIHWFNPMVWVAYSLFCSDIEFACDERVVSELEKEARKKYAHTILMQATDKEHSAFSSAFGKHKMTERIKRLLFYKAANLKQKAFAYVFLVLFVITSMTNRGNIDAKVIAYATEWFLDQYNQSYEVSGVDASLLRSFEGEVGTVYTVRLSCQTKPKFECTGDPFLDADANFDGYEDLTTEIRITTYDDEMQPWEIVLSN